MRLSKYRLTGSAILAMAVAGLAPTGASAFDGGIGTGCGNTLGGTPFTETYTDANGGSWSGDTPVFNNTGAQAPELLVQPQDPANVVFCAGAITTGYDTNGTKTISWVGELGATTQMGPNGLYHDPPKGYTVKTVTVTGYLVSHDVIGMACFHGWDILYNVDDSPQEWSNVPEAFNEGTVSVSQPKALGSVDAGNIVCSVAGTDANGHQWPDGSGVDTLTQWSHDASLDSSTSTIHDVTFEFAQQAKPRVITPLPAPPAGIAAAGHDGVIAFTGLNGNTPSGGHDNIYPLNSDGSCPIPLDGSVDRTRVASPDTTTTVNSTAATWCVTTADAVGNESTESDTDSAGWDTVTVACAAGYTGIYPSCQPVSTGGGGGGGTGGGGTGGGGTGGGGTGGGGGATCPAGETGTPPGCVTPLPPVRPASCLVSRTRRYGVQNIFSRPRIAAWVRRSGRARSPTGSIITTACSSRLRARRAELAARMTQGSRSS